MEFVVGATFDSFSDFDSALGDYSKTQFANFFKFNGVKLEPNRKLNTTEADVESFQYQRLYLKCKYHGKPKLQKNTKFLRQTASYKSNCDAEIVVHYESGVKKLKIHKLSDTHNHARSAEIYSCLPKQRSLGDEAKIFVEDGVKMKANPRLIQRQVKEKYGQTVTVKDIHNRKAKVKFGQNKTIDRSILEEIRDDLNGQDGVDAEIMVSADTNTLEGIYIQDERMRKYFDLYPEVLIMDATYKLNDRRMPLFVMVIIDGNGESQIVGLCLLRSENYIIVKQMMEKFKSMNPKHNQIKTILTDKSFPDRKAYTECFPGAQLQLCIFHVIQAWIREISAKDMNISSAEKKQVLLVMNEMLFAPSERQYNKAYENIRFPVVKEYIDRNWHPLEVRKQWATYLTDNMQNYLNRTTNRIESLNQKLKTVVTRYGRLNTSLKEAMQCIHSLNVERDYRTIVGLQRVPILAVNETNMEFKYRSILTSYAYNMFLSEIQNLDGIVDVGERNDHLVLKNRAESRNVAIANATDCSCRFFKSMVLPCRHIIYFRKKKNVDDFAANLCAKRWLKANLPAELIGETQAAAAPRVLSQLEKYRKVHEVTQRIAEMVSEKPTALFETFLNALKECEGAIADDKVFAIGYLNDEGK